MSQTMRNDDNGTEDSISHHYCVKGLDPPAVARLQRHGSSPDMGAWGAMEQKSSISNKAKCTYCIRNCVNIDMAYQKIASVLVLVGSR